MDIFCLVDDKNSELIAAGLAKEDLRSVIAETAKSFNEANQPLLIFTEYHNDEFGEYLVMIFTNKTHTTSLDGELWESTLLDYIKQLPPDGVETFKIARF